VRFSVDATGLWVEGLIYGVGAMAAAAVRSSQFAKYCVFLIRHEMAKYFWLAGVIDIRG
jgi:hypothetical protein